MAKRRQDFRWRRVVLFEASGDDNKAMVIDYLTNMTKNLRNQGQNAQAKQASWWGCRSYIVIRRQVIAQPTYFLASPIMHPLSIWSPFAWHCLYSVQDLRLLRQTLIFLCHTPSASDALLGLPSIFAAYGRRVPRYTLHLAHLQITT